MKEVIYEKFGTRLETESTFDYINKINKECADKLGFTEYHALVHKEMKPLVPREHYQYACAYITGYEKQWVTCIYNLIKKNLL